MKKLTKQQLKELINLIKNSTEEIEVPITFTASEGGERGRTYISIRKMKKVKIIDPEKLIERLVSSILEL